MDACGMFLALRLPADLNLFLSGIKRERISFCLVDLVSYIDRKSVV